MPLKDDYMAAHLFAETLIRPAFMDARERREMALAVHTRELAYLRFSNLLTAKWASSVSENAEQRNELRGELVGLRRYQRKIDEIAMTFCVQDAMKAQQEVERSITLPSTIGAYATTSHDNKVRF
jgi:hypothetical protein